MAGSGHCPPWLLGCPRCLCGVTHVNTPMQIAKNTGSWCQSITCNSCGYCWYVCTECKNTRKHIDSQRKLLRHTTTFHQPAGISQKSKKRKKETTPGDNIVVTDIDIENDSTRRMDPADYDTFLESYSNEGNEDVLLDTVHPMESFEESHHTTNYGKVVPEFSREQSSRFFSYD